MLVTLGVNLLVVRYESERGRAMKSELLLADAAHTRSDVLTSCAVLVSLVGVWLGYPALDAIGGVVIAVFIAHTGLQIGREASGILSDRVVMNEDDIRRVVMDVPEVRGCHHIRTRGSADHIVPRPARLVPRRYDARRSAPPVARGQGSADAGVSAHPRCHHPHRAAAR